MESRKGLVGLVNQTVMASKQRVDKDLRKLEQKSEKTGMTVLGIDQSFSSTGWAILTLKLEAGKVGVESGEFGTIVTPSSLSLLRRAQMVRETIRALLDKHRPDLVGIEHPLPTGQWAAGLTGLFFLIMDYVQHKMIDTVAFQPTQLKSLILRKKDLSKAEIQREATSFFDLGEAVNDDEADALFLAWFAARFDWARRSRRVGNQGITDLSEAEIHVFFSENKTSSKAKPDLKKGMVNRPGESYFDFSDKVAWLLKGEVHVQRAKRVSRDPK